MNADCDICQIQNKPEHRLLQTDHWNVSVGNNHAYLGRAYVTLREHKSSLSELDHTEWREFEILVPHLEKAYAHAFGADPINWSCLMNNAYQHQPTNPHVHWHLIPRYREPPVLDGTPYPDDTFAHHYEAYAERILDDATVTRVVESLLVHL